jgi:hypothetical protein
MKRKTVRVGNRDMEIVTYDTPLEVRPGSSVVELNAELDDEEKLYAGLGPRAVEAALRLLNAATEDRAVRYWEIGRLINDQLEKVEREAGPEGTKPFQKRERIEESFLERLSDELKRVGAEKSHYSKPYLRKMSRLARLMTRDQVDRPIPYPLYHELLHDELSREDIDEFLQRCENGEFGSSDNMKLRAAVNRRLLEKEMHSLAISDDSKLEILDRASKGELLGVLRRDIEDLKPKSVS